MAGLQFMGLEKEREKRERERSFLGERTRSYSYVNPLNS